ncbi:MAG TPA: hypothetical protein VMS96_02010 [Terriglobales bacterium]|nr:hypothetical protein [Terriglobales bacterium]
MAVVISGLIRLLELLFVLGCCGSLAVILLSGIEDVETIFNREKEPGAPTVQPEKQS